MTNGEKYIEELLSWYKEAVIEDGVCYLTSDDKNTLAYAIKCCKHFEDIKKDIDSWMLREESSSSKIPTGTPNTISFKEMTDNLKITADDIENAEDLEYSIEPLVHPKNDLGVDCVDKTELLKAMNTWDKFGNDPNKGLIPLKTPALQDRYVPYVKYDDMVNCVKGMPSVKPQEPKTGHWIFCEGIKGKDNVEKCSCCQSHWKEAVMYRNDTQEYLRTRLLYCPNCGAKMVEPQESEE